MRKISVICFTNQGAQTALKIRKILETQGIDCGVWCKKKGYCAAGGIQLLESSIHQWTEREFQEKDALIFVGATGIAVRSIAPFLKSKATDPAVIAVDEKGAFVISLVSGHIGGANELCTNIAEGLGAVPVITTATDRNGKFAVDVFARKCGLWISSLTMAKWISARLLDGDPVGFHCDFPVNGEIPAELTMAGKAGGMFDVCAETAAASKDGVCLSDAAASKDSVCLSDAAASKESACLPGAAASKDSACLPGAAASKGSVCLPGAAASKDSACSTGASVPEYGIQVSVYTQGDLFPHTLRLVPGAVVLGIGCRRGKSAEQIENYVLELLQRENLSIHAIGKVCSIDVKAQEEGILRFCGKYHLPFETFSAEQLREAPGEFQSSRFVSEQVGVDNVCERSAVLGSKGGVLLLKKEARDGMTLAAALREWRISFE